MGAHPLTELVVADKSDYKTKLRGQADLGTSTPEELGADHDHVPSLTGFAPPQLIILSSAKHANVRSLYAQDGVNSYFCQCLHEHLIHDGQAHGCGVCPVSQMALLQVVVYSMPSLSSQKARGTYERFKSLGACGW